MAAEDDPRQEAALPSTTDETAEVIASQETADTLVGRSIGKYRITQVIASGGMGTVYLAVQEQPRRRVALKLMKAGIASRSALRRFEFEVQILGRLHHPGIAQIFDAGTHDTGSGGLPYFAMEYVPNAKPIDEYANDAALSTRDRLALFVGVCDAVHHGHQKGIIHRDLKPSNILVDSSGQPKVIDFGVARSTDSDLALTTLQTNLGQLVGTLQYMSPEQYDADPDALDTRSDVYSLGVVLYELLCRRLPYDLSQGGLAEAARVVHEQSPLRPSTVDRTLRGDIETISLKALEKDTRRRYQSAGDLGRDIERYLNSAPIEARPPSLPYQLRMFTRRHRSPVLAATTVMVVLLVATVISGHFAIRAYRAQAAIDKILRENVGGGVDDAEPGQTTAQRVQTLALGLVLERDAALQSAATLRSSLEKEQAEADELIRLLADAHDRLGEHEEASRWRARLPSTDQVAAVADYQRRRLDLLERIHCFGTMTARWVFDDGQRHFEPDLSVDLWLQAPADSALRAEKLGEVLAWFGSNVDQSWRFDRFHNDETVLWLDPHDEARITGRQTSMGVSNLAMFDLLGLVEMEEDQVTSTAISDDGHTLILRLPGRAGLLSVHVNLDLLVPVRVEVLTAAGELVVHSVLAEYRPADVLQTSGQASPLLPSSVHIINFARTLELECNFETLQLDDATQAWDRLFDLSRLQRAMRPDRLIEGEPGGSPSYLDHLSAQFLAALVDSGIGTEVAAALESWLNAASVVAHADMDSALEPDERALNAVGRTSEQHGFSLRQLMEKQMPAVSTADLETAIDSSRQWLISELARHFREHHRPLTDDDGHDAR